MELVCTLAAMGGAISRASSPGVAGNSFQHLRTKLLTKRQSGASDTHNFYGAS